jgi:hypothetical protein
LALIRTAFVAALLLCGCSREAPETPVATLAAAPADFTMSSSRIGPVRTGMSAAEIEALGLAFETRSDNQEGEDLVQYVLAAGDGAELIATMSDGAAVEVATTSPQFADARGAHVGMTLDELRALHPDGFFYIGNEAGDFMSYTLPEGVAVFAFDTAGIDAACFQPRRRCPTPLGSKRATRYFVR